MSATEQAGAAAAPSGGAAQSERRGRLVGFLEAYALVFLLIAVVVFFSFYSKTSDTFPTLGNFQAVVGNQAVVAIVALAALIPIACNQWDLSVGATAGVSSIYVASAMSSGTPIVLAILLGIGIGLVVGIFNAVVVTRFGVNGIIATLGTATLLAGVTQAKTGGVAIVANIPASVVNFGSGTWLDIPKAGWLLIVITLLVYYLLNHTPFGRYVYAVGANPEAARLVGLRSERIVAIFFLAALNAGLNLAGSQDYVTNFVNGAALIIGVGLAAYLGRRRRGA